MTEKFSYAQVKALIKRFTGQSNILAIPRPFISFTGDHMVALFLNQVIYWSDRTTDPNGWFYKKAEDWQEELGISYYQLRRATRILRDKGVETKIKTVNGIPHTYYRLNDEVFMQSFMEFMQIEETSNCRNLNNQIEETSECQIEETSNSIYKVHETTCTETTTETTCEREQLTLLPSSTGGYEKKKRDSNLDHPAVQLYREICHLTANELQRKRIAEEVADLELWEDTLENWMMRGYRPNNVDGLLDSYRKAQAGSSALPTGDEKKQKDSVELEILTAPLHPTERGEWMRRIRSDNPETRAKYIQQWQSGQRDLKYAA